MLLSEAYNLFTHREIVLKGGADKTRRNYETSLNSLLAAVGDIPVALVTLEHVARWQEYQYKLGHQSSTIKSNQGTLRCVLRFLKKHGVDVLDYRDIELPKVNKKKHVVLDYSEVQDMIDATDSPRDKAIVACLFSTGCRISELLDLNRGDIVNGEATVLGKGSKLRPVFFDDKALEYLDEYLATRKDRLPPLFISGQYRRITVSRVEQILHILSQHAGIEKVVTPHVFRHSNITNYIINGAPMGVVSRMAGHSSIKTTLDIYTHVPDDSMRDVANNFRQMKKPGVVRTNHQALSGL